MAVNKKLKKYAYMLFVLLILYLFMRYLLSWFLPFILAFLLASALEPLICFVVKRTAIGRKIIALFLVLAVLAGAIGLIVFIAGRAIFEITAFIKQLPAYLAPLISIFRNMEENMYGYIASAPPEVQAFFVSTLDSLLEQSSQLPGELYNKLFSFLTSVISGAPDIIFFSMTFALSSYFLSAGYPELNAFLRRQIPENRRLLAGRLKKGLLTTVGTWLRAQLTLMTITFIELAFALTLIGIDYSLLIAALISIVDALPMLGSGTILIPWLFIALISGETERAVLLLITYCSVLIVRGFLEPKLLGTRMGIHPVAALFAVYVGFRAAGIAGVVAAPVLLMLLKQFNDSGYIHFWK